MFAQGDYYKAWEGSGLEGRRAMADHLAGMAEMMEAELDPEAIERLVTGADPTSIDEALLWSADSGTHSVLDVGVVADKSDFGTVTPLGEVAMERRFATTEPTSEAVTAAVDHLHEEVAGRWTAISVVGHEAGRPASIFFVGVSGD